MTLITSGIEIKSYNEILFSINSLSGDILINDDKWDFIFDFYEGFKEFYFIGNRLQFEYPEVEKDISYLSEELISSKHDNFEILLKVKSSNLFISRNLLEKFWSYYEYPAIFFSESKLDKRSLLSFFEGKSGYDDFVRQNRGVSILYRSFELNVVWLAQDQNHHLLKE